MKEMQDYLIICCLFKVTDLFLLGMLAYSI